MEDLDLFKDRARLHDELLSEIEPVCIDEILSRCQYNQAAAARIPGMALKTLRSKITQSVPD